MRDPGWLAAGLNEVFPLRILQCFCRRRASAGNSPSLLEKVHPSFQFGSHYIKTFSKGEKNLHSLYVRSVEHRKMVEIVVAIYTTR